MNHSSSTSGLSSGNERFAGAGTQSPAQSRSRLTQRQLDLICALILAVGSFALYAATAVPGAFDGDYGEFQYLPRSLGLPHPTGYPIYMLLGWVWSWLPVGTMAFRMNLLSALWAALTLVLLYLLARQEGLKPLAALGGALAFALAPAFWQYAGLAAVYSLHTALLAAALNCWVRWSAVSAPSDRRWLWAAAFFTGLALTNHPTAAFLVPAAAVFLLSYWIPPAIRRLRDPAGSAGWADEEVGKRPNLRELLVAGAFFVVPGLLYLYVPQRLWAAGACSPGFDFAQRIGSGLMPPYIDCALESMIDYVTGRSLLVSYGVEWSLMWTSLPRMLVHEFGLPLALVGVLGSILWLLQRPRTWLLLAILFLPAAAYAVTYDASFAARDEIAHLAGHLLPALLVFSVWIAQGISDLLRSLGRLLGRAWVAAAIVAVLLALALGVHLWRGGLPTAPDRVQSLAIEKYWTEVLSYPLEQEAALTGHWGDLTAFWYFQHGEGMRPDLEGIYPPSGAKLDGWFTSGGGALYLAGPVLDWNPGLLARYRLTPWGILVRISEWDEPPVLPPMTARSVLFGEGLHLDGYAVQSVASSKAAGRSGQVGQAVERRQIWLAWHATAPTPRDLSVSMRLHTPDGALLHQEDGRLASLWFPEGTLQPGQQFLSVFDIEFPEGVPVDAIARVAVYDPETMETLQTGQGQGVVDLGPLLSSSMVPADSGAPEAMPLGEWPEGWRRVYLPLVRKGQ